MKKNVSIFLSITMFLFCLNVSALTTSAKTLDTTSEKYEVLNGNGELMYIADSLEEAENYMNKGSNNDTRSIGSVFKVAKVAFQKGVSVIGAAYTIYKVGQVIMGKADVADVIKTIVPVDQLNELREFSKTIFVYSRTDRVINPYPPHSFEGAMWKQNNFYYVVQS